MSARVIHDRARHHHQIAIEVRQIANSSMVYCNHTSFSQECDRVSAVSTCSFARGTSLHNGRNRPAATYNGRHEFDSQDAHFLARQSFHDTAHKSRLCLLILSLCSICNHHGCTSAKSHGLILLCVTADFIQ